MTGERFTVVVPPKKCPICGRKITGYPAISRKDGVTEICSDCGTVEALMIFIAEGGRE